MKNSTIAIITARGGSKRIPRKNIKEFCGKPMMAYAIEACKNAGMFSEIMVSTDCDEIAGIAKSCGASVPFMRSEKTSDDFATTFDVLEEVVSNYIADGKSFDYACCVYPCVPFLSDDILKKAFDDLIDANADAIQPVCKYPVPIEWAMNIENGNLVPDNRAKQQIRSQDLTPKYYDAGMFYIMKTSALLKEKTLTPINTIAYIMDEREVQDIDTQSDWEMAEIKYRVLHESRNI